MIAGDELREFSTPAGSVGRMEYKAGYAIAREKCVVASFVIVRNDHWKSQST
jgi:hypothetical protein